MAEEEKKEPTQYERFKANPVVSWGQRSINIATLGPITLADKIELEKRVGRRFNSLVSEVSAQEEAMMLHFILQKFAPDLTLEEVYAVPARTSTLVQLYSGERSMEIDHPILARSIDSPAPTVGGQNSSSNSAQGS